MYPLKSNKLRQYYQILGTIILLLSFTIISKSFSLIRKYNKNFKTQDKNYHIKSNYKQKVQVDSNFINWNKTKIKNFQLNSKIEIPLLEAIAGKNFYSLSEVTLTELVKKYIIGTPKSNIENTDWKNRVSQYLEQEKTAKTNTISLDSMIWDKNYNFTFDLLADNTIEINTQNKEYNKLVKYYINELIQNEKTPYSSYDEQKQKQNQKSKILYQNLKNITDNSSYQIKEIERYDALIILAIYLEQIRSIYCDSVKYDISQKVDRDFDKNKLTPIEKSKIYLSLFKFEMSLHKERVREDALNFIKKAQVILNQEKSQNYNSNKDYINLIYSLTINSISNVNAKQEAIFNIYKKFGNKEYIPSECYAITSICSSNAIEEAANLSNFTFMPFSLMSILLFTELARRSDIKPELKARAIISAGIVIGIKKDWESKKKIDLLALEYALNSPPTAQRKFLIEQIINYLMIDDINLNTPPNNTIWKEILSQNPNLKIIPFLPDLSTCSEENYKKFISDYVTSVPLRKIIQMDEYLVTPVEHKFIMALRKNLRFASRSEAKKKNWRLAYQIKLKEDSIPKEINIIEMYNIGRTLSEAKDSIDKLIFIQNFNNLKEETHQEITKLKSEANERKKTIRALDSIIIRKESQLKSEASKREKSIRTLDSTIIIKEELLKGQVEKITKVKEDYTNLSLEYGSQKKLLEEIEVEKIKTERNLKYALFACVLFVLSTFIAIKATKNAQKERNKSKAVMLLNKYKSEIWQELGHNQGETINEACARLILDGTKKTSIKTLYLLANHIQSLFGSLESSIEYKGNDLEHELMLAITYVKFYNERKKRKILLKIPQDHKNVKIPPAIIFTCIKNSIKHGQLDKIKNPIIEIDIIKKSRFYEISILDNGLGFNSEIISISNIETGTGLRNANEILKYYNESKENAIEINKWIKKEFKSNVTLKIAT